MNTAVDRETSRNLALEKFLLEAVEFLASYMDNSERHHDGKLMSAFLNKNTIALKFLTLSDPDDHYGRGLDYLDAVRRMAPTANKTTALTTLREAYTIVLHCSTTSAINLQHEFDKIIAKYNHDIL